MNLLRFADLHPAVVCLPSDKFALVATVAADTAIQVAELPDGVFPNTDDTAIIWDAWLLNGMKPLTKTEITNLLTEVAA